MVKWGVVMKDKLDNWIQIIIPAISSIIFGSVGLFLITQFKERLPVWFYNALLYVIYFVFIAILVFFLSLLVRAAFGEWLRKQIKEFRQQRYRRKLANQLFDKWIELSELVEEILKEKDKEPTSAQSEKYFSLHIWFISFRSRFLPEWHRYESYRVSMAHENEYWDSTRDLGYKVLRENSLDPFSYFYEPLSANMLMFNLKGESLGRVRIVLIKITELTLEFVRWISR